jgi:hypothetical protein
MLPRVLRILLAHDGIVAASPMGDVARLLAHDQVDQALHLMSTVIEGLASCQPLIESGALRFTEYRPALVDDARKSILGAFNVDPSMTVLRNFVEAAVALPDLPSIYSQDYLRQANELFKVMGVDAPNPTTIDEAARQVSSLASALIEVSWQIAVCAMDNSCDLALVTPLERQLAELALSEAGGSSGGLKEFSMRRTRHLWRLSAGDLPNLTTVHLTAADALAIRHDDAFAEFRSVLRNALDAFDERLRTGQPLTDARAVFEEHMIDSSLTLETRVRKTSFKARLRDASVPVVLGAASAGLLAPLGPEFSALGGSVASLSGTIWQWLNGRRSTPGTDVAYRYISMLGGHPRSAPANLIRQRGRSST